LLYLSLAENQNRLPLVFEGVGICQSWKKLSLNTHSKHLFNSHKRHHHLTGISF